MTATTEAIDSRYTNSHILNWLAERAYRPWPGATKLDTYEVSATTLHEAYNEALERVGAPPITLNAFGRAMAEAGVTRAHQAEGTVYRDVTPDTRAERAEKSVVAFHAGTLRERLLTEAQAGHMERVSHEQVRKSMRTAGRYAEPYEVEEVEEFPCDPRLPGHCIPDAVVERIEQQVQEHVAGLHVDGTIARDIEAEYRYYLNGHPAPDAVYDSERAMDALERLGPILRDKRAALAAQKDAIDQARVAYYDARREEWAEDAAAVERGEVLAGYHGERRLPREHVKSNPLHTVYSTLTRDARWQPLDDEVDSLERKIDQWEDELRACMAVLDRVDHFTNKLLPADEPDTEPTTGEDEVIDQW